MCQHSHYKGVRNPGTITIRKTFGALCANTRTTYVEYIGILAGITTSWVKNPPEEWDSAGNYYQLIDNEFLRGRGFQWESPVYLRGFRPVRSKCAGNPLNGNNSRISSSKSYMLTLLWRRHCRTQGVHGVDACLYCIAFPNLLSMISMFPVQYRSQSTVH
jgi:hypothetical protein